MGLTREEAKACCHWSQEKNGVRCGHCPGAFCRGASPSSCSSGSKCAIVLVQFMVKSALLHALLSSTVSIDTIAGGGVEVEEWWQRGSLGAAVMV